MPIKRNPLASPALIFTLTLGLCCFSVSADVTLPNIYASHMVLQRDVANTIWGHADPGEAVTLQFGEWTSQPTQAGDDGRWRIELPTQKAGTAGDLVITANNTITLEKIIFGDVWICSGQSNMVWQLFKDKFVDEYRPKANYPNIRLFSVSRRPTDELQDDLNGRWVPCTEQTAGPFSAVGYYFGMRLHEELDIPIGLINTSFGGTPAEAWTPLTALKQNPKLDYAVRWPAKYKADYPKLLEQYEKQMAEWEKTPEADRPKRKPRKPREPGAHPGIPSNLYNGMIHPLTAMKVKGVIWYQGENNAGRHESYSTVLSTMIQSWRDAWGQPDMPFGIVQLANYRARVDKPVDSTWARIRESQAAVAQQVPNCGLALAIDIGEARDIHPRNKRDVGFRLSRWALAAVYGKNIVYSGPVYKSMKVEGNTIRLTFNHIADGLVAKGDMTSAFAIAGEDKTFHWADATLDGNTIVLKSSEVPNPVAARYAWQDNPPAPLYNSEDLPAVPFQTSDW